MTGRSIAAYTCPNNNETEAAAMFNVTDKKDLFILEGIAIAATWTPNAPTAETITTAGARITQSGAGV